ncbi:hypothetical protein HOLleu_04180 [Holothuria leucospilota]|uniref:B box-type domain-containing protein n=1 Tax=Holothuria leucospilota TaxID=206669 RepID=A0A9Q1HI30_HOLLE|nr:hypothetical protein HOLleu_04180 [Holothuria leucospilota]
MATSSEYSAQFGSCLFAVSNILTEQNVQDVTSEYDEINPDRKKSIKGAADLFSELQGHGLLNEKNVNDLASKLEELKLERAAQHLKKYQKEYLAGYGEPTERCFLHEKFYLQYFCATCAERTCAECAEKFHNMTPGCKIFALSEVKKRSENQRDELEQNLYLAELTLNSAEMEAMEQCKKSSHLKKYVRNRIEKDYLSLLQRVEHEEYAILDQIMENKVMLMKKFLSAKNQLEKIIDYIDYLRESLKESHGDILNMTKSITWIENETQLTEKNMEDQLDVLRGDISALGNFSVDKEMSAVSSQSTLIGGVLIQKNQLVHLYDERHIHGGVNLVCIDPTDASREYWRHLVIVSKRQCCVVMSYISLWYNSTPHVLFAAGNIVFIVQHNWHNSIYESVASVQTRVIDEIREDSYITSIFTCAKNGKQFEDEFLISISNCASLKKCRISNKTLQVINTGIDFIKCASYAFNIVAVATCLSSNVVLLTTEPSIRKVGYLRPKPWMEGLLTVSVIWDGTYWIVLYVRNKGQEKEWKIIKYERMGEFVGVCAEGEQCDETNVPVSVARCKNTLFVSFPDKTVSFFRH